MPLSTLSLVATVAPTVMGTSVGHYINRKPRRNKPTAHISYDLGLNVVRKFIKNMANNSVEDVQSFTGQWVPAPAWVKVQQQEVPQSYSREAADHLITQFGPKGIEEVGGQKWWQWRKNDAPLKAEWIEMRKDYQARGDAKSTRILFYVHGGAYYFGSVDEHRYQIQRHARKLKARAFAPRYRLAPQFPFPCGLHDCLTAYLFLLSEYDPRTIIFAGDSAGGGMIASLLVILRDQELPMPAGAILLSPWVDLTHSFPSICGDGKLDYIPTQGFIHRPSVAWPPPRLEVEKESPNEKIDVFLSDAAQVLVTIADEKSPKSPRDSTSSIHGESGETAKPVTTNEPQTNEMTHKEHRNPSSSRPDWIPGHVPCHHITPKVELDGKEIYIQEQIQLYASNFQLVHPLVSPALSPSLGGLCPLLIQVGSGELLADEQVYFAHKAANPTAYPPSDEILDRWDPDRTVLNKYPPTNVQLQVWDDLCHVPHTLAWTRPAKYMYRSAAQFGAWALARAQQTTIDIDDAASSRSTSTDGDDNEDCALSSAGSFVVVPRDIPADGEQRRIPEIQVNENVLARENSIPILFTYDRVDTVGKAGDPLPPFEDHMIRQRVDRHGKVYPLGPANMFFSLKLKPGEIGIVKEAPVHRWLERQIRWENKYIKKRAKINQERSEIESKGLVPGMEAETPPPTALVRRWIGEKSKRGRRQVAMDELKKRPVGIGLKWWSEWGSKHDAETMQQQTVEGRKATVPSSAAAERRSSTTRERRRSVVDEGQADHGAIHSSANSPRPQATARPLSSQLQVPQLDITGRTRSSQSGSGDQAGARPIMSRPTTDRFYSAEEHL